MRKLIVLISLILHWHVGEGQIIDQTYFSDTIDSQLSVLYDHIEVEDGIIISGEVATTSTEEAVVMKLNVSGEVLWSTLDNLALGDATCSAFSIVLLDDGFVYGTSIGTTHTLWKIDAASGEVVWTNEFYTTLDSPIVDYSDYDSTTYLLAYKIGSVELGLAKINKADGDTIETNSYTDGVWLNSKYFVEIDDSKNIYYAYDLHLIKYNLDDLNIPIWTRDYFNPEPELDRIDELYLDQFDEVFLFAREEGGIENARILKIDKTNGTVLWDVVSSGFDVTLSDYKDVNGKLFATYQHTLAGGGSYYIILDKFEKILFK